MTYGDLHDVQPFGESLVKLRMTGDQVRSVLEGQFDGDKLRLLQVSGLSYAYDETAPEGDRISGVALPGGEPLQPRAEYTVAVDGPLAGGAAHEEFGEARHSERAGGITESLADYAASQPQPFHAPDPGAERRIVRE